MNDERLAQIESDVINGHPGCGESMVKAYRTANMQMAELIMDVKSLRATVAEQAAQLEQARLVIGVLIELDETDQHEWPTCFRAPVHMGRAWLDANPAQQVNISAKSAQSQ